MNGQALITLILQAVDSRDALAKALYDRLFRWLVDVINKSILPPQDQTVHHINILDIFGFESFDHNSFEQFCINYTNERLQQEFVNYVLRLEQEEYKRDELSWSYIDFTDNKECLDLIEKKPIGMLYLLDDECRLPDGADQSWLEKVAKSHAKCSSFGVVRTDASSFVLGHYVGKVQYCANGFLEKSRDSFRPQFQNIEKQSSDPFVCELLTLSGRSRGYSVSSKRPTQTTLGIKFKEQVDNLMKLVHESNCHYLRCIRPNEFKKAEVFNDALVLKQLKYSGMLSTIELRRAGYPIRLTFDAFVKRYKVIFPSHAIKWTAPAKAICDEMLSILDNRKGMYQLGKSMVFLRYQEQEVLERHLFRVRQAASRNIAKSYRFYRKARDMRLNNLARKIQKAAKAWLERKKMQAENLEAIAENSCEELSSKKQSSSSESDFGSSASESVTDHGTSSLNEPLEETEALLDLIGHSTEETTHTASSHKESDTELPKSTEAIKQGNLQHEQSAQEQHPQHTPHSSQVTNEPHSVYTSGHTLLRRRSILPNALPKVVARMFEYLRMRGIDQVGIFRVAGAAAEIQSIMKSIEEGKDVVFHSVADCNVVATVLKQYIRNMKEPIATYKLYEDFVSASEMGNRQEMLVEIQRIVERLPPFNRLFLQELCLFLSQVAEHSSMNKMVPSNLAIVFAPNIFRGPPDMKDAEFIRSQNTCVVMTAMIECYSQIFDTPGAPLSSTTTKMEEDNVMNYQLPEYAMLHFNPPSSFGFFWQKASSVMDLLVHTKSAISQPLHKKITVENKKDAVECFKNVMRFMGDAGNQVGQFAICQAIVEKGIKISELRDEILAQICRQVSNNSDVKGRVLGWQLMSHCLSCFPPSSTFIPFLRNFITGFAEQPTNCPEKKFASSCLYYLKKIPKKGPRQYSINMKEFDAVAGDMKLQLEVRTFFGQAVKVPVSPTMQVHDVCIFIAQQFQNQSQHLFMANTYSLFIMQSAASSSQSEQTDLPPHTYVMDILAGMEEKISRQSSKSATVFYLLFKQRLFTREELSEKKFHQILHAQLAKEYVDGLILVPNRDVPFLSACEIQRHHGNLDSKALYQLEVSAYLPRSCIQTTKGSGWRAKVLEEINHFAGMSADECIQAFLAKISRSQLYGSTPFHIKYKPLGGKSADMLLLVSMTGLYIWNKETQSVQTAYRVSNIVEGVTQDNNICEIFYEEEREMKVLHFECSEAKTLIRLLNDYITFLKSRSDQAVALFDYHTDDPLLLKFSKGDTISVMERNPFNGWYRGACHGNQGWFPGDYVRILIKDVQISEEDKRASQSRDPKDLSIMLGARNSRSLEIKPPVTKSSRGPGQYIPNWNSCVSVFDPMRHSRFFDNTNPVAAALQFSSVPIRNPLTRLSPDDTQTALEGFICIMKFMGDYVTTEDSYMVVDFLCGHGLSRTPLRAEFNLQIIKQITNNPKNESVMKGLLLMSMLAGVYVPDKEFLQHQRRHLKELSLSAQSAAKMRMDAADLSNTNEINNLVLNTASRLRRTLGNTPRILPPPRLEFEAIMERKRIVIRIELPDAMGTLISIDSATTASEALTLSAKTINLKEDAGFCIYVRAGEIENAVPSHFNMMDLVSMYERSPSLIMAGAFSFALKKRIFLPTDDALQDPTSVRMIFFQMSYLFANGFMYIDSSVLVEFMCHFCVAAFGLSICQDPAALIDVIQPQLERLIPARFLLGKDLSELSSQIVSACQPSKYAEKSAPEVYAGQQYLSILEKWTLYGSQFYVFKTNGALLPALCILAIKHDGCYVVEFESLKIVLSIPYEHILNWGAEDGQMSISIGNLMQKQRHIFMADPVVCSDASALIQSYYELRHKHRSNP
eukprot:TRINITY_DN1257_c0_g1_i4.p1 TRINITY_DN1257_c0_g1~~TRINITY_DN1257_c0_g1_i4.p1  ORF type:complete len:1853 (-),score=344.06 TRINITY_DN1257_c0_g1_i4:249-5807(-)